MIAYQPVVERVLLDVKNHVCMVVMGALTLVRVAVKGIAEAHVLVTADLDVQADAVVIID
jgi:hypothetical protein